jgi:hypothetical protein
MCKGVKKVDDGLYFAVDYYTPYTSGTTKLEGTYLNKYKYKVLFDFYIVQDNANATSEIDINKAIERIMEVMSLFFPDTNKMKKIIPKFEEKLQKKNRVENYYHLISFIVSLNNRISGHSLLGPHGPNVMTYSDNSATPNSSIVFFTMTRPIILKSQYVTTFRQPLKDKDISSIHRVQQLKLTPLNTNESLYFVFSFEKEIRNALPGKLSPNYYTLQKELYDYFLIKNDPRFWVRNGLAPLMSFNAFRRRLRFPKIRVF